MDRDQFYEESTNRILTVFPQKTFHHNAYIIGGRKGLEALRAAIDEALDPTNGKMGLSIGVAFSHPGDDEVNATYVILDYDLDCQEEGRGTADDVPIPYYDKRAAEALADGAVSLSPSERHIMAAGVKSHCLMESLNQQVDTPAEEEKPKGKRKKGKKKS